MPWRRKGTGRRPRARGSRGSGPTGVWEACLQFYSFLQDLAVAIRRLRSHSRMSIRIYPVFLDALHVLRVGDPVVPDAEGAGAEVAGEEEDEDRGAVGLEA